MNDILHSYTRVDFNRFKAFKNFSLRLRNFNVLVGPNNAGKSTVLTAFRILAHGMRMAEKKKARPIPGGKMGHIIDLEAISVAPENIFYDYIDDEPASVVFHLSTGAKLTLLFPEPDACYLVPDSGKKATLTPTTFKSHFKCPIGFVPILGPVDPYEQLYASETARRALFNYRAARNFRNIWYHYPEKFDQFRTALQKSWPGMDIEPPTINATYEKTRLDMFCPEERKPREIFWAGFGFQVWCQMLTHLIQSTEKSIFLIDEPDIYLHSDLQRQLLSMLKNLGPDIVIATHSTEIIQESDPDDIVLINKHKRFSKRISDSSELPTIFSALGSNTNPILSQLSKTKKAVFVEGKDFQILGRMARRLENVEVSRQNDFAVVPVEGFNPDRIQTLIKGIELTLGSKIRSFAILDRDFRSDKECDQIERQCEKFCDHVIIHNRKEIENFLLVPDAIDRAISKRVADRIKRSGKKITHDLNVYDILDKFAKSQKPYISGQYLEAYKSYSKKQGSGSHPASLNEEALRDIELRWETNDSRLRFVPGKDAIRAVNREIQDATKVSITYNSIVDAMKISEIPIEMAKLIQSLSDFARS